MGIQAGIDDFTAWWTWRSHWSVEGSYDYRIARALDVTCIAVLEYHARRYPVKCTTDNNRSCAAGSAGQVPPSCVAAKQPFVL